MGPFPSNTPKKRHAGEKSGKVYAMRLADFIRDHMESILVEWEALPPRERPPRLGLKKSAVYDCVRKRLMPQPVRLGSRTVAWASTDIDNYCAKICRKNRVRTQLFE